MNEDDIQHIIDVRRDAMASADRLRAVLDALGVDVKDTANGTTWVRRDPVTPLEAIGLAKGAVPVSVPARAARRLSVADYGASPMASGDVNSAAVEAAINAAEPGDLVEFGGGTYALARPIMIDRPGITISGCRFSEKRTLVA